MTGDSRYGIKACKGFEEDLVLYYYGECQGLERERVMEHLQHCPRCESFLQELSTILPLAHEADEPPEAFWEQYSKEMRRKLATVKIEAPWWKDVLAYLTPRIYGALATAFALILTLVLAFDGGDWFPRFSSEERPPQEIQAVSADLEFLQSLELMEVLDLLEEVEPGNRGKRST